MRKKDGRYVVNISLVRILLKVTSIFNPLLISSGNSKVQHDSIMRLSYNLDHNISVSNFLSYTEKVRVVRPFLVGQG